MILSSPKFTRFGEKLKSLRKSRGMTQTELAEALGYANINAYISSLESGRKVPTAETVLAVARLFDISTDVLLKDELDLPS